MKKFLTANYLLLATIIIIAVFFRVYNITTTPPGLYPDEAMNGNNALEAIETGDWKVFYPENNGREGLFINIQALSIMAFGNTPWALRIVSSIFGIFTVLGIYFLTKELFKQNPKHEARNSKQSQSTNHQNSKSFHNLNLVNSDLFRISDLGFRISHGKAIGLLSAFFLAINFWHINFSRIGFRAIMAPFFAVWAFYFLLKTLRAAKLRTSQVLSIVGGIFFGLGFYSYIAYRPLPILIIIILGLHWIQMKDGETRKKIIKSGALFILAAIIAFLPLGLYFLNNPEDFMGRTTQVSVFKSAAPSADLFENIAKTLGMFFVAGDYNWRHNYAGRPELAFPVAILFAIGGIIGIKKLFAIPALPPARVSPAKNGSRNPKNKPEWRWNQATPFIFLLSWLAIASLPVVISNEGIPHALRAIVMIPPVIILAGFGGIWLYELAVKYLRNKTIPVIASAVILLALTANAYIVYFLGWANQPEVKDSFTADFVSLGNELNSLPRELPKYLIVEAGGTDVRGLPMPTQTTMFITDTFTPEKQKEKNIFYILPSNTNPIPQNAFISVIK